MDEDVFNMSIRKFLKKVGVTSQQQIEQAIRAADPSGKVKVRAVVTIPELDMEHVVEGEIDAGGGSGTGA